MTKKASYSPIGDEVNASTAILQATQALDVAAQLAVECRDHNALVSIADSWINMGINLAHPRDDDDQEVEEHSVDSDTELHDGPPPIGFRVKE